MAARARAAGSALSSRCGSPASRPVASPTPRIATRAKFAMLVSMKNAAVRLAISSFSMPPRFSAHAPSASPPAPPAGSSAFAPSSDMPTSVLTRQLIRRQKVTRKMAT